MIIDFGLNANYEALNPCSSQLCNASHNNTDLKLQLKIRILVVINFVFS